MRISFWQFLGLLVVLAMAYFAYNYWWVDQSQGKWAGKLHNRALNSSEEIGEKSEPKDYGPPDSFGR